MAMWIPPARRSGSPRAGRRADDLHRAALVGHVHGTVRRTTGGLACRRTSSGLGASTSSGRRGGCPAPTPEARVAHRRRGIDVDRPSARAPRAPTGRERNREVGWSVTTTSTFPERLLEPLHRMAYRRGPWPRRRRPGQPVSETGLRHRHVGDGGDPAAVRGDDDPVKSFRRPPSRRRRCRSHQCPPADEAEGSLDTESLGACRAGMTATTRMAVDSRAQGPPDISLQCRCTARLGLLRSGAPGGRHGTPPTAGMLSALGQRRHTPCSSNHLVSR